LCDILPWAEGDTKDSAAVQQQVPAEGHHWGLTTVSQHAGRQGMRAAYALVDALESENEEPVRRAEEALTVELMVRETTGRA